MRSEETPSKERKEADRPTDRSIDPSSAACADEFQATRPSGRIRRESIPEEKRRSRCHLLHDEDILFSRIDRAVRMVDSLPCILLDRHVHLGFHEAIAVFCFPHSSHSRSVGRSVGRLSIHQRPGRSLFPPSLPLILFPSLPLFFLLL